MTDAGPAPDDASARRGWIRQLIHWIAPHRRHAFVAFGVAIAGTTLSAFAPLVQKIIVDDVVLHDRRPLAPWITVLVVIATVRFFLAYLRRFRGGRIALDVQHDLRTEIFRHLQRLDFQSHDELSTGQLVSRASSDIALVQGLLMFLPVGSANVIMFVVSIVIMAVLSPVLTLILLAVGPLLLFTSLKLRTSVFPASWDAQQRAGDVAVVVEESVTGVRVVKGFGQERQQLDRLVDEGRRLYGSKVRLVDLQARLSPVLQVIPALGQVAGLALGGWLVIHGSIELGTFLAFSNYMLALAPPVRMLASILTVGQLARAGVERIVDLLDCTPLVEDAPGAIELPKLRGEVAFDDVTFGYSRQEPVVDGFTLTVAPGETVALVGASGSGKSTCALLLPRFYDVLSGTVRVDGHDVRGVTIASLRGQIGVVFEDSFLFSDTIRSNIAFGKPDATDADVEAAARAVEAHDFVCGLPEGYDTVVGEHGLTLSGGQRQRIALARALITDPQILILDDATSAVDARIEEEIHTTLRRVLGRRTTLLIAHRRSSLSLADRIVVVEHGHVLDAGTHDELWVRCSHYRHLLAGPGDDVEGADAPVAVDAADAPDPWRVPTAEELGVSVHQMQFDGGRVGPPAGGGAAGMANLAGRLEATPELLAQVAALPTADRDPDVDTAAEARNDESFRLVRFARRYRRGLLVGLALVTLDGLATLSGPAFIRHGIDQGVKADDTGALMAAAIAFGVVTLVDWYFMWAQQRVLGRTAERMLYALRVKVFAHLQRLGVDFYEHEMAGRIMTRMTTDVDALSQLLQSGLVNALVNLVTFVGVGVALVVMNAKLALLSAVVLPVLVVATIWFRRGSGKAYEVARERIATVNANLQEGLSGVRVSQAFVREDRNQEDFEEVSKGYLRARLVAQRMVAIFFPLVDFLSDASIALVLAVGTSMVHDRALTAGALIAFVLYLDVFFAPIQQLSQVFDSWQQAVVSLDRIDTLLETPTSVPDPADPVVPGRLRGEIELRDVTFRYANTIDDALRGVELRIAPGETVALVGETGAGKSTVLKLVARFYDVTGGALLIDGIDVRDFDPVAYHRQLGIVPQEAFLFAGTIRDNLAYGKRDATDAEIEAAARAVGAHDFIAAQRFGYHTPVSERGRSLSSGQRQLIALARAYLVDPAILLLDEATSNLDLETEAAVSAAMERAAGGRTTVLIAHRLQTARLADRILVVDDGRVVEAGTHDELVAVGGFYARLWAASNAGAGAAA